MPVEQAAPVRIDIDELCELPLPLAADRVCGADTPFDTPLVIALAIATYSSGG